jgi:hypothetical protein
LFRLPDVGEEATINYNGEEVTINVHMLNDIRKLGFGNYGSVMLAEVENHRDIKMAVKVCFTGNTIFIWIIKDKIFYFKRTGF